MSLKQDIEAFLLQYEEPVPSHAFWLREVLLAHLPGVTEQLDLPARMVAYGYGPKYADLVCTIIPSKKGLKLGFNRGIDLADPAGLLEGTGKISRYVVIHSEAQVQTPELIALLDDALRACRRRASG